MGAADDTETATKNGGKISDTKGKRLYELLPRIFDHGTWLYYFCNTLLKTKIFTLVNKTFYWVSCQAYLKQRNLSKAIFVGPFFIAVRFHDSQKIKPTRNEEILRSPICQPLLLIPTTELKLETVLWHSRTFLALMWGKCPEGCYDRHRIQGWKCWPH